MSRRIGTLAAAGGLAVVLTACQSNASSSDSGGSAGPVGGSSSRSSVGAAVGGVSADANPSMGRSAPVTGIPKRPSAITGSNNGDSGAGCTAALSIQKWDNDKPGNTVTGAAKVICLEPPRSLTHTLYLEYQSGADPTDSWHTEDGGTDSQFTYSPDYTFLVGSRCRVGTWRLRYHAEGMDPNQAPILVDFTTPDATIYITKCGSH